MLTKKIQEDLHKAIKNKELLEVSVLRMLLAAVFNKEKEKRYKLSKERAGLSEEEFKKRSQLTDEEVIEVIFSEAKKRKEAILGFEKGQRSKLAEKEKKELEILKRYLPQQLSSDEIKDIVREVIVKTGAEGPKDIGRVMAELMPKLKGRADGKEVANIVKDFLSS